MIQHASTIIVFHRHAEIQILTWAKTYINIFVWNFCVWESSVFVCLLKWSDSFYGDKIYIASNYGISNQYIAMHIVKRKSSIGMLLKDTNYQKNFMFSNLR